MSALNQIQHIVVLMLENRSFDSMLGKLYPKSPGFDGLSGSEANRDAAGVAYAVHNKAGSSDATMSIPTPDPGESWTDINMQLFGTSEPQSGAKPDMSGFVKNYEAQATHSPGAYDPGSVMHYFTPEQVPVISKLARQFAVCDRWFASAPCQTWPNRFFVHTATANGYENNSPVHFPYRMPTIYNRIDDAQLPGGWKIYFHDVPQSITLEKLSLSLSRFRLFDEFLTDAKTGDLPAYSFIEPRYFADVSLPNDQHPPHVATLGEQLIADVYNAVRSGPAWTRTLLVITYDEHGGCYDHVPPPPAQPPEPKRPEAEFDFSRYGVRVPAVIVSPFVRQGTVLRPHNETPFDHTSIIATLRKRFPTLGPPLTERDAVAVITADHPLVSQAIDELRGRGVPVVAYVTDLSAASRAGFVGTDNWKRGRTAAWFIRQTADEPGKVFPLVGSNRYQCQDIADASFRSYMREHAPAFQISDTLLTHEVPENAYEIVRGLIAQEPEIRGIFVNGGGISGVLRAMRELPPDRQSKIRIVCSDVGPETRKGLNEGLITASLSHPLDRMPAELIDVMLRLIERRESSSIEQRIVPFDILTPESIWT